MAVNTNLFRHLSARWITRESAANKIYCGVSKTLMLNDSSPAPFNESFDLVSEAINSCCVFSRVNASFVKETNEEDYDVAMLTKQRYSLNNITNEHSFLDNIQYWKYITPEEALSLRTYNTITSFILKNIDETIASNFHDLKTFYFFFNLKINGEYPENLDGIGEYFQILPSAGDTITADGIVIIEKLSYVYNNVDAGVCDQQTAWLSVPDGFQNKINYFISF